MGQLYREGRGVTKDLKAAQDWFQRAADAGNADAKTLLSHVQAEAGADESPDRLLDLDRALARLRVIDPAAARLVDLRYFAGLTMAQAADVLGLPLRTAERNWTFARTWLHRELSDQPSPGG